jgi:hypothetical protein
LGFFGALVDEVGVSLLVATHAPVLGRDRDFTLLPHEIQEVEGQTMRVTIEHG